MSLKQAKEVRTDNPSGTDALEDNPHKVALDELVPQIRQRSRNAVQVDRVYHHFYQRRHTGRRCSCFAVETSPDGQCVVCFGTGIVGGYDKFGCITTIVDTTYPNIVAVNVSPNFDKQSRPVVFELDAQATSGYIQTQFEVTPNTRMVDVAQLRAKIARGTSVKAYVKSLGEASWVELNSLNLSRRLSDRKLDLKVELKRDDPSKPLPNFSHVAIRYQLMKDLRIKTDVPRRSESITLAEFGIYDSFQTQNFFVSDEIRKVTTEDFFVRLTDGTRWKVIEVQGNTPLEIVTSHDLVCRIVQSFEAYKLVP